jgi:hypothetical protein
MKRLAIEMKDELKCSCLITKDPEAMKDCAPVNPVSGIGSQRHRATPLYYFSSKHSSSVSGQLCEDQECQVSGTQ